MAYIKIRNEETPVLTLYRGDADDLGTIEASALAPVIDALDAAISGLPSSSEWKRACLEIRRHMAESCGLPLLHGTVA